MSYRQTARRYVAAAYGLTTPDTERNAADRLPIFEHAEKDRSLFHPGHVASTHALYVENLAAELRDILAAYDEGPADPLALADELQDAARALLEAIGEGFD